MFAGAVHVTVTFASPRVVLAITDFAGTVDGVAVFDDCESAGIWVNSADDPANCTFILPAVTRRGPVTVAVGTDGSSPASATAMANSSIFRAIGTREPSKDRMPRANAMSVAVGIAQPRSATGSAAQSHTHTSATRPGSNEPMDLDAAASVRVPLRRKGWPEDIAKVVLFLASDEASYVTGQLIGVDGGMSIH